MRDAVSKGALTSLTVRREAVMKLTVGEVAGEASMVKATEVERAECGGEYRALRQTDPLHVRSMHIGGRW